ERFSNAGHTQAKPKPRTLARIRKSSSFDTFAAGCSNGWFGIFVRKFMIFTPMAWDHENKRCSLVRKSGAKCRRPAEQQLMCIQQFLGTEVRC
ncbi:hypothetical protein, partial [Roseobacter litoralis]|uniref:hypothetical protein n=1 Tax=Roseobacter litoralis TaxID=42443 RepID=UPI00249583D6